MSTATELLRRALEDWDFSDTIETLDPIFNEIRAFLAAELAARKPMTDEEIDKGIDTNACSHEAACAFAAGIRCAEKHHGITE